MKFQKLFILISLPLVISCDKSKPQTQTVDNFVFSHSAMYADYSMKFSQSDTVYIQRRFPGPTEQLYFIIKEYDKQKVLKLAEGINFAKYDSVYDQYLVNRLVDGTGYMFYVAKGAKKDWIYIYGNTGPKEFYDFSNLLNSLKEKATFHKTNNVIDYANLEHILLPEPPASLEIK